MAILRYLNIAIYVLTIFFLRDYYYNQGLNQHKEEVQEAMQLCKAGKYEEAYVAFDRFDGMRCFKESTNYPHRAKGYSIVAFDYTKED